MSEPFFNTPERIAGLDSVARSWIGTPYMENSAVLGTGASCQFLTSAIYKATGFLAEGFNVPRGTGRRLSNGPGRAVLEYVDGEMGDRFAKIAPPVAYDRASLNSQLSTLLLPGDLIILEHEEVLKHFGIVLPALHFIHVLRKIGVRASHLHDATYSDRVAAIRRPLQ